MTAVAVAMAYSGGDDSIIGGAWSDGVPQAVGLWGVPVEEGDLSAIVAMQAPKANAAAAYRLWVEGERTWSWAPVGVAGALLDYGPAAVEAVSSPRYGVDDVEATIDQALARVQSAINTAGIAATGPDLAV